MFLKKFLNEKASYKLNKIVEIKNRLNGNNLIYITSNKKNDKAYDFQKYKIIRSFGRKIYDNDLLLDNALEQEIRLNDDIDIFKKSTKRTSQKRKKALTLKNVIILLNER